MIAGLGFEEAQKMPPGMVLDCYIYRRGYDDMEHGIRREVPKVYD